MVANNQPDLWSVRLARAFAEAARTFLRNFPSALYSLSVAAGPVGISLGGRPRARGDFERRIEEITTQLRVSGTDAQQLLDELQLVMDARREQVMDAQARLLQLQIEESEIAERVELLRSVKPEAATAINALLHESLESRDKRSTRRDWLIFAMGVLVSIVLSLVFFLLS